MKFEGIRIQPILNYMKKIILKRTRYHKLPETVFGIVVSMTFSCIASFMFTACERQELLPEENDKTLFPDSEKTTSKDFSPTWDKLIDRESPITDGVFIGTRYLGVQNWLSLASPPYLYVGATFPQSTFATSFDKEVTDGKYPIDLLFNFSIPYIGRMENPRGTEYLQKMKEAVNSDEYKSYTRSFQPYKGRLANLQSLSNIESCFPDNKDFGKTLEKITRQEFNLNHIKSLSIGEIVFKGFTVSMDVPAQGLFINTPSNLTDLVYIRALTYGVAAYFVIASDHSYKDVLTAFKTSFVDAYEKPDGVLNESQIILLTVSDVNQEADIKASFDDLKRFVEKPFSNGQLYGYPIFCKGYSAQDNSIFEK